MLRLFYPRLTISILMAALCAFSSPASAWELIKRDNGATTAMEQNGIRLSLSCSRGQGFISMVLTDISEGTDLSAPLKSVETSGALMLWIELPDGRTSRDSFTGFNEQGSVAASIPTTHISWDFFANGHKLWLQDSGKRERLFESGMKGTGAARLAFRERCGI